MYKGVWHLPHLPRSAMGEREKISRVGHEVDDCGGLVVGVEVKVEVAGGCWGLQQEEEEEEERVHQWMLETGKSPKGRQAAPEMRRQVLQWQYVIEEGRVVEDQVVRLQEQWPVRRMGCVGGEVGGCMGGWSGLESTRVGIDGGGDWNAKRKPIKIYSTKDAYEEHPVTIYPVSTTPTIGGV